MRGSVAADVAGAASKAYWPQHEANKREQQRAAQGKQGDSSNNPIVVNVLYAGDSRTSREHSVSANGAEASSGAGKAPTAGSATGDGGPASAAGPRGSD